MRILGIDPGTATTGYGVIETNGNGIYTLIDFGWVKTSNVDAHEQRLMQIYNQIQEVVKKHNPDEVAMEKLFFATNAKTAIAVGQSMGVIMLAVTQAGKPMYHYSPVQIKLVVGGSGRADKIQMKKTVRAMLKFRSPNHKKTFFDDVCDALAVAICHTRKTQEVQIS
jgi:crossover junction endodeoxyribonuclease RuvC